MTTITMLSPKIVQKGSYKYEESLPRIGGNIVNVERPHPRASDTDDPHVVLGPTGRKPSDQMSRAALDNVVEDLGLKRGEQPDGVEASAPATTQSALSKEDAMRIFDEITSRPKALAGLLTGMYNDPAKTLESAVKKSQEMKLTENEKEGVRSKVIETINYMFDTRNDSIPILAKIALTNTVADEFGLRNDPPFKSTMIRLTENFVEKDQHLDAARIASEYLDHDEVAPMKPKVLKSLAINLHGLENPESSANIHTVMNAFNISTAELEPNLSKQISNIIPQTNADKLVGIILGFGLEPQDFKEMVLHHITAQGSYRDAEYIANYVEKFGITAQEFRTALSNIEYSGI